MDTHDFDRRAFVGELQVGAAKGVRIGPAVGAAVACVLAVLGAAVLPGLVSHPLGTTPAATGAAGAGSAPGQGAAASNVPASSSYELTYASSLVVGAGAQCCGGSGGAWTATPTGGFPAFTGRAETSVDSTAWYEWSLGEPVGGHRWDQLKVRVWIPSSGAAWVRFTVTTTAGAATNVSSYDVPEQEYQGWYELPATFLVGTPDRRTGSAWVRMTYLRPYSGAAGACGPAGCRTMAAAQIDFRWS